jgi:hypothetical protein
LGGRRNAHRVPVDLREKTTGRLRSRWEGKVKWALEKYYEDMWIVFICLRTQTTDPLL